jgi:hypothetical protein
MEKRNKEPFLRTSSRSIMSMFLPLINLILRLVVIKQLVSEYTIKKPHINVSAFVY